MTAAPPPALTRTTHIRSHLTSPLVSMHPQRSGRVRVLPRARRPVSYRGRRWGSWLADGRPGSPLPVSRPLARRSSSSFPPFVYRGGNALMESVEKKYGKCRKKSRESLVQCHTIVVQHVFLTLHGVFFNRATKAVMLAVLCMCLCVLAIHCCSMCLCLCALFLFLSLAHERVCACDAGLMLVSLQLRTSSTTCSWPLSKDLR